MHPDPKKRFLTVEAIADWLAADRQTVHFALLVESVRSNGSLIDLEPGKKWAKRCQALFSEDRLPQIEQIVRTYLARREREKTNGN